VRRGEHFIVDMMMWSKKIAKWVVGTLISILGM
jgi:hypothetical protein